MHESLSDSMELYNVVDMVSNGFFFSEPFSLSSRKSVYYFNLFVCGTIFCIFDSAYFTFDLHPFKLFSSFALYSLRFMVIVSHPGFSVLFVIR